MGELVVRQAIADDADVVAALHAESWRRSYRGIYSDSFLDGDVLSDRRHVWARRLAASVPTHFTLVAELDGVIVGFIYVVLDNDTIKFRRVEYDWHVTRDKIYNIPDLENFLGDRLGEGR